jgi:guanylate kinase
VRRGEKLEKAEENFNFISEDEFQKMMSGNEFIEQ